MDYTNVGVLVYNSKVFELQALVQCYKITSTIEIICSAGFADTTLAGYESIVGMLHFINTNKIKINNQ